MGSRLLPRTLPELLAYSLRLEREAAQRFETLEHAMREAGIDHLAEEFERIAREEREQYELIELGTGGRELPRLDGWELAWHFAGQGPAGVVPAGTREALASALAFERRTQAFYLDVAENVRDASVRAFAADMAHDEERHVARLELLLEREPDPAALGEEDECPGLEDGRPASS